MTNKEKLIKFIEKIPEKYKIGVNGARNYEQMLSILQFMNILLYLYFETYINKNKHYLVIKDKLHELANVAKRQGNANEVVNYVKENTVLKQAILQDKKRLGYQPEEGQNQYSRLCQNSGQDKRRQTISDIKDIMYLLFLISFIIIKLL